MQHFLQLPASWKRASWSFQWSRPKTCPMAVPEVSEWSATLQKGPANLQNCYVEIGQDMMFLWKKTDLTWLVEQGFFPNLWSVVCWKNGHVGWHCFTLLNSPQRCWLIQDSIPISCRFWINRIFRTCPTSFAWLCLQDGGVVLKIKEHRKPSVNHQKIPLNMAIRMWGYATIYQTRPNHKQLISCIPFYPMISQFSMFFSMPFF